MNRSEFQELVEVRLADADTLTEQCSPLPSGTYRAATTGSGCTVEFFNKFLSVGMFKTTLVEAEISDGRLVVDELRRQQFPVTAAFWYYFDEAERWRLVIISRHVQTVGPRDSYRRLVYALADLRQRGTSVNITSERIHLLGEESLIFKHVRDEVYGSGRSGFRVTQGPVENLELDDAYVYTI